MVLPITVFGLICGSMIFFGFRERAKFYREQKALNQEQPTAKV